MRRVAPLAGVLAAVALTGALPARGQDPGGGTEVGGAVPSFIELSVGDAGGFSAFPAGPGVHELGVPVTVTATAGGAELSIADGDIAAGSRRGRLSSGDSTLSRPLEARVGATPFQPLDSALDPLLERFRGPVANAGRTLQLRQVIEAGEQPQGTYSKTILITVSAAGP